MDPQTTPFPGKRRPVAAPAPPAPKPKSIATTRAARMAKRSPTGSADAAPQPRPLRRAFGTTRSSNALVEKPPPLLQKPSKVSLPPPLKKPSKLSPPPLPKPSKMSPPAMQKPSKLPPAAIQKPSKLSPPNPVRVTKTSRLTGKPPKKVAPGGDLEAKTKKRSQRVSFEEAAVGAAAPAPSGEKAKAYADDAAGHTPMVAMRAAEKPAKVLAAETPFFSAQNCSSCTLDQLELATYWLDHIRLAESVGKHWVAAAFFRLAFECQAQPIRRIQSELRSYTVRHESAGTLTPLFDELLTAHGRPVNQPKFDTDGYEKMDTTIAINAVDKNIDMAKLKVDECLECDSGDDLVDVGAIIVDKHDDDVMGQPSFQRKLNESFEFDDSEAVIVDQLDEANFDLLKNVKIEVPCSNEIIQSACRSSTGKLSPRGTIAAMDSSSGHLSFDNPSDKLSPGMGRSSSKRLSSGSSFDKKSPLSSKRLTSSCPSYKKSAFTTDLSSEQMPSGSHYNAKHNAIAGAGDHESKVTQDVASEYPALYDQLESKRPVDAAARNEMQ
ncbi:nascent polypeptide-associated complex subunit alpha, muscle-specific form-like [Panicum miliaceum]|uniref:Nascent polypeptide-associated complex subunit alpha, muscle-specific form-like n=1 Tax=Panicum miliaceum TaxID=4540 RepID=A0A3L6TWM9_PANMI|nr:nascent polypeptide-associated complex subunit alpha, muscle-specific form-like [Panicum miliaceum]